MSDFTKEKKPKHTGRTNSKPIKPNQKKVESIEFRDLTLVHVCETYEKIQSHYRYFEIKTLSSSFWRLLTLNFEVPLSILGFFVFLFTEKLVGKIIK